MTYTEKSLTCSDCGKSFPFTAEEQEFFASKGFTNEPKRCPACRSTRRVRARKWRWQRRQLRQQRPSPDVSRHLRTVWQTD